MRLWHVGVIGAILCSACGGNDDGTEKAVNCAARSGLYEATAKDSGTCGLNATTVLQIDYIDGPAAGCTVKSRTVTSDNCQVLIDLECELSSGASMVVHRFIEWNSSGTGGEGSVQADAYDAYGNYDCSSNLTITYRKK